MVRIFSIVTLASFSLPLLWLAGIFTADIARVLLAALLMIFAIASYQGRSMTELIRASSLSNLWTTKAMALWLGLVLIIDGIALFVRKYDFSLGFDQGIFIQAAHSFSQSGKFLTSFNRVGWESFMNDHFSPILAVPGLLIRLGIDPNGAIVLMHIAAFALTVLAMAKISHKLRGSYELGILAAFVLFTFPNFRHMLSWGTDIEYFGLPFVMWAWWAFISGRHGLTILLLLLSWLCKEMVTTVTVAFCLMAIIELKSPRLRLLYGALALVGCGWFFLYTLGHHHLFGNPYFHIGRVAIMDTLTDFGTLAIKLAPYALVVGIALLLNPALIQRPWLTLPALPGIAMIMISSKPAMADYQTHYSLPPTLFILTAAIVCPSAEVRASWWQRLRLDSMQAKPAALSVAVIATVLALLFSLSSRRPALAIVSGLSSKVTLPAMAHNLDPAKATIVSMGAVPHLLDGRELIHIITPADAIQGIDYAVVLRHEEHRLHATTLKALKPCYEDADWRILCRNQPAVSQRDTQPR